MEEKSNLSQRTAEIIRRQIHDEHKYQYGQKLPNENELSEELGVSRTTLRDTDTGVGGDFGGAAREGDFRG